LGEKFNLLKDASGLAFFTIPSFDKMGFTISAFSTRFGGYSLPPYDGLNMSFHVGDDWQRVVKNRQLLCHVLGLRMESLVAGKQVHGDEVAIVDKEWNVDRNVDKEWGHVNRDALPEVDGLICNQPNIPLIAFFADCVPVYILDPVRRVIGLAHAGWKGTVLEIARKVLQKMQTAFDSKPCDCLAAIGPSIGPCCYEVDAKVLDMARHCLPYAKKVIKPLSGQKGMFDLWLANALALEETGVPSGSICTSGLCTACNTQMFFSHRKEKGHTGRMAALLMLK
jgi:YfiH family protein